MCTTKLNKPCINFCNLRVTATLIAVTSCLDAVVAGINVCNDKSVLCGMLWIKYTGYANFANDIGKAIIFRMSWHLSKANWTY